LFVYIHHVETGHGGRALRNSCDKSLVHMQLVYFFVGEQEGNRSLFLCRNTAGEFLKPNGMECGSFLGPDTLLPAGGAGLWCKKAGTPCLPS